MNAQINIAARAPQYGKAKTRLAKNVGKRAALRVHHYLLKQTVRTAVDSQLGNITIYCAGPSQHPAFKQLKRQYGVIIRPQVAGDLGRRMHQVFKRTLASYHTAILIGTDCCHLQADDLRTASEALLHNNSVFFNAADGGYVLIGLQQPQAGLFASMPWGTPRIWAITQRRLMQRQQNYRLLGQRYDIDTLVDLRHAKRQGWLPKLL